MVPMGFYQRGSLNYQLNNNFGLIFCWGPIFYLFYRGNGFLAKCLGPFFYLYGFPIGPSYGFPIGSTWGYVGVVTGMATSVSSITNTMNHLRSLKSVETKQLAKLERYLQDKPTKKMENTDF